MTTSNSTNFSLTRDQISAHALTLLGVYGQGDTVSANDYTFCSNALNMMVKAWESQGVHLWTQQEGAIFLTEGKQHYDLSSSASDISGDDVVVQETTADSSGTSVTVSSTTGMNVSDNIGIVLDAGTIQWTTIAAIPTSTSITLNASISSASSSGNNVFVFTTRVDRPLSINSIRFVTADGYERPLEVRGRADFMNIPNKTATAPANVYCYSPKVSTSRLYVWPTCDDVNTYLRMTYTRRIQDFDSASDTPDLPQEWLEPIVYNLAIRVAPAYGISTSKLNPDISIIAQTSLEEMKLWDSEEGSIIMTPNCDYSD